MFLFDLYFDVPQFILVAEFVEIVSCELFELVVLYKSIPFQRDLLDLLETLLGLEHKKKDVFSRMEKSLDLFLGLLQLN